MDHLKVCLPLKVSESKVFVVVTSIYSRWILSVLRHSESHYRGHRLQLYYFDLWSCRYQFSSSSDQFISYFSVDHSSKAFLVVSSEKRFLKTNLDHHRSDYQRFGDLEPLYKCNDKMTKLVTMTEKLIKVSRISLSGI